MTGMYDHAPGDLLPLPRELSWTVVDAHRAGRRCTACTDHGCPRDARARLAVGAERPARVDTPAYPGGRGTT